MKKLLILLYILITQLSLLLAADGEISGTIRQAKDNEEIIGANIIIKGTTIGTTTDINGSFSLKNIAPGNYTLVISYISFQTQEVQVTVRSGERTIVNLRLEDNLRELAKVDVVSERITNTEKAVVIEIRESRQIVSGISQQEIVRSPDRDAAQVAARIPGITIVENSFVMIRGLSQRYNQVQINGINAPSSEPDSRSFSFDLFPSSVLDRMLIYKSGSEELPGDFAGGVIRMFTQSAQEENTTSVSIGSNIRVGTHFKTFSVNPGSPTDFLGFDSGKRQLPNGFPSNLEDVAGNALTEAGRTLNNNFNIADRWVAPDLRLGFHLNRFWNKEGVKIGNVTAFQYGLSSQFMEVQRNRYSEDRSTQFDFSDQEFNREARWSLMHNWSFKPSKSNQYAFKNTINQIGEASTIIRTGIQPQERLNDEFLNYSYQFLSRTIYTGQIEGKHDLREDQTKLQWVTGFSYIYRDEPDFRRLRSTRPIGTDNPFTLIDPPGATTFDNARFYSKLNEWMISHGLQLEHQFRHENASAKPTFKAGYYIDYKQRSFAARWMSYTFPSFGDPVVKQQLVILPINETFAPENINNPDGWRLQEGTNPSDRYTASSLNAAVYAGFSYTPGRWNLNVGLRNETFLQTLTSATNNENINVRNVDVNPLPFLNIGYRLNETMILRLAYGYTVNRPEFRELAPFLYYNFRYDVNYVGNPNLRSARIHNVDLRYEFYPQAGDVISIGAFYKYFINPIENYVQTLGLAQQFIMGNAPSAYNYGAEIEWRKRLGTEKGTGFGSKCYTVINAAYIFTQVDLGNADNLAQEQKRQLQGQSPFVVNLGLHYQDKNKGWSSALLYNVFGPRIFFVGNSIFPTVYEMPRHVIDFTLAKTFAEKHLLKLTIGDLLNYPTRLTQDSNRDTKIRKNEDDDIQKFRRGTAFGLSYQYRF